VSQDDELKAHIAAREWYHTLELRPGLVTPGWFDTRPIAPQLPWPDLSGRRCLDVGTFDGFWAFEMERRGAREVVAVDILDPHQWDWPVGSDEAVVAAIDQRKRGGDGFLTAARELGSSVCRLERSVYDLDPAELGTFDVVYLGSLLLHLRDPVRALSRVRDVVEDDGRLLLLDAIDLELSVRHRRTPLGRLDGVGRPWWWRPNMAALRRFVEAAGFVVDDGPHLVWMPPGAGQRLPPVTTRSLLTAAGRQNAVEHWRGDPHAWVLASPRPLSRPA
jgi:tRNA (mo5U34)-methyltransferase